MNLIAPELVITHPMSSMSGFITYLDYTAGSNKGSVEQGDIFNGVFGMPQTHNQDGKYTSSQVVEVLTQDQTKVAWTPVVEGSARFLDAAGEVVEGGSVAADGTITAPVGAVKVAYEYDNIVIPQNDLPILNVVVKNIPLVAHARRIAIYYSQMAAFEAKTDYGFDLGDDLATQAVGQLAYKQLLVA